MELDQLVRLTAPAFASALLTGLGWCLCLPMRCCSWPACVDMVMPFSVPMRVIIFYSFLLLPLVLAFFTIIRPAFERMPLQKVALRIEALFPGMHNRLVTVLDLIHGTANTNVIQAIAGEGFAERLLEQTRSRLANFTPGLVANLRPVFRAMTALGVAALFIVIALVLNDRMPTAHGPPAPTHRRHRPRRRREARRRSRRCRRTPGRSGRHHRQDPPRHARRPFAHPARDRPRAE